MKITKFCNKFKISWQKANIFTYSFFSELIPRVIFLVFMLHSDAGKCYDNARMESFFATLKKEKLYRMNTTKMTVEQVKSVVFRYVMIYYNRKRISTVNPEGLPPSIFREQSTVTKAVA